MTHVRKAASSRYPNEDVDYVLLSSPGASMDPYDRELGTVQDLRGFTLGYSLVQVLGLSAVLLVTIWASNFMGGFSGPSNPKLEFNYHPVFMVLGMVFLYGNGILVYRALRTERKSRLKLVHGALMALAFLCAVAALKTVFDSHNLNQPAAIPNLYSLHSWLGLTAVLLFCMQLLTGFVSFLFPGVRQWLRAQYLPLHVFFGLAIFGLAVATALLGISEKLFFRLASNYSHLPGEAALGNLLGLCLLSFAVLVVFLATRTSYRRTPLPEEASLPLQPHSPME